MLYIIFYVFLVQINQALQCLKILSGQTTYSLSQSFLSIIELTYENHRLCLLEACIRSTEHIFQSLYQVL
jgi:hypothetical protein